MAARMLKYLWLVFLIGLSAAAYALTGTSLPVDVPITITASSPTPPPGAVAAGFTTLAISLDFQVGQACVAGTCVQTSPFSNWLDCAGATSPQWFAEHSGFCGQITQTTDQGQTVLDLSWILSEYANGWPDTNIGTKANFQNGFYYEVKARSKDANPCPPLGPNNPQGCLTFDAWSYPLAADQSKPFIEWDFIEQSSNLVASGGHAGVMQSASASAPTGSFREPGSFGGYDPTAYHVYGWRNTVDGNGGLAECYYYDDTPGTVVAYCSGSGSITPVPMVGNGLILTYGPQTLNVNCGPSGNATCNWQIPSDGYVQYVHLWACAGWQSGPCNTAILTGPP